MIFSFNLYVDFSGIIHFLDAIVEALLIVFYFECFYMASIVK